MVKKMNTGTPRVCKSLSDADPPAPAWSRHLHRPHGHTAPSSPVPSTARFSPEARPPLCKNQKGHEASASHFACFRGCSLHHTLSPTPTLFLLPRRCQPGRPALAASMAMAEWWEAAAAAIVAYTGMTPAAFFTAVAVAAALYVAVSGLLARPVQVSARRREAAEEERALEPLPPPVQLGEVTEEELRAYDGSDPKKPLLMAIKGQIYDVTQSRMFYGPGGPYALFAGRDASRALAKMSFETSDLTSDISGLSPFEAEALQEWEYKFKSKYITVGTIKKTVPVVEGDIARSTVTTERDIDASTLENNSVPEPKETGASNQGSLIEKTTEMQDVDVNTSSHEDIEKGKELPDSDATNASSQIDAVEKPDEPSNLAVKNTEEVVEPKEIPDAAVKNSSTEEAVEPKEIPDAAVKNSSTEEAVEPKDETPQVVDDNNICKPEDATEKPNEEANAVGLKNTNRHEDAVQPKETRNIDEKDVSSRKDGEEKPKETSDVEAKNA